MRLIFFLTAFLIVSCARDFERLKLDQSETNSYINEIAASRLQKDTSFKSGIESPLTPEQRTTFKHLEYYPPNLDLIFQVKLIRNGEDNRIDIQATGGELRPALKIGEFEFETSGKKVTLHVYEMIGEDSTELFLPFSDKTCGSTSYAGGRYIDLKENSSGIYRLDFNYAYDPYCAYNHNYSCPIVPAENHLDVPIPAGEMKFQ